MDTLTYKKVTGRELERVVEQIEEAVSREEPTTVMMACISIAVILQAPMINSKQLVEAVQGCSEWIALFVAGLDSEPTPPNRMN